MEIVETPAPILLKKAQPVEKIDSEIHTLIKKMKETLLANDIGIGLAAPQVGISLQIFLAAPTIQNVKDKTTAPILVCINPTVVSKTEKLKRDDKSLEGCLSIPHIWGTVGRSERIRIKYQDETGKFFTKTFSGMMATIIQHELDHLNGILFTHRVIEQHKKLYRMNRITEELERVEI